MPLDAVQSPENLWRNVATGVVLLTQLFRNLTFSTFSEGSKGNEDCSDGMLGRVSHLSEMPENCVWRVV